MCRSVVADSKGYFYFSGESTNAFRRPLFFNTDTLELSDYFETGYLVKTDTNLNTIWIKKISGEIRNAKIAIDHEDNIIYTAVATGKIKIDKSIIKMSDTTGSVIIKFSSEGYLLWYSKIKGSDYTHAITAVRVDKYNNIFIAGIDFGGLTFYNYSQIAHITISSTAFMFFAKYSSKGLYQGVKVIKDPYNDFRVNDMVVDNNDNVYLTGMWAPMDANSTFDKLPTKPGCSSDVFIAKYGPDRKIIWLKQFGSKYNWLLESGFSIALDEEHQWLYVTGAITGQADLDGTTLNTNDQNIFLAKYQLDGRMIWIKTMGSWSGAASYTETGKALFIDSDGFIYLGGTIGQNATFDNITFSAYDDPANSNLYFDLFAAKITSLGRIIWATHAGGVNGDDNIQGFCKNSENILVAIGQSIPGAIFDQFNLGGNTNNVGFACKLKEDPFSFLDLSKQKIQFDATDKLTNQIEICSSSEWNSTSSQNWITSNTNQGNGCMTIIINALPNTTNTVREAELILSSKDGITKKIQVKQSDANSTTEKQEIEFYDFLITPNPASQAIRISSDYFGTGTKIKIFDTTGALVMEQIYTGSPIDISGLKMGIYYFTVSHQAFSKGHSFMKY